MIFYVVVVFIAATAGFLACALLSAPAIADRDARIAELEHELDAVLDVR